MYTNEEIGLIFIFLISRYKYLILGFTIISLYIEHLENKNTKK